MVRSPGRGPSCLAALAAVLFVAMPGAVRAQNLPAGFDQGIIDMKVGRQAAATVPMLVDSAGRVYLPLTAVLSQTGLPVSRAFGDSVITIPRVGAAGDMVLDLRTRTLTPGADPIVHLDSTVVVRFGAEVYIRPDALAAFLQARADVDFSSLVAVIVRAPPFPSEQGEATVSRRQAAHVGIREPPLSRARVDFQPRTGGLVFDWSVGTSGTTVSRQNTAEVRTGVGIYGGDLTVGALALSPALAGDPSVRTEVNYRRVFPDRQWLRQVEIGSLIGGGSLLRSMHGIRLTNQPLFRDQYFTDVPLVRQLPAGWQYEVYQDGQLLGYSDASSGSPVAVPLRYGGTPVQVRLLSPAGEQIVSDFMYQVSPAQLPPGRTEYTAGAGQCAGTECRMLGFADLSRGFSPWLTLGLAAELRSDSIRSRTFTTFSAAASTLRGLSGQVQASPGQFSRVMGQYYGRDVTAALAMGVNDANAGQVSVLTTAGSRWYLDAQADRRLSGALWGARALRFDAGAEGASRGAPGRLQASFALDRGRGSYGLALETDGERREKLLGVKALWLTPATWRWPLRTLPLQGLLAAGSHGITLFEGATSLSFWNRGAIALTLRWRRGTGTYATIGYAASVGFARMTSRMAAMQHGPTASSLSLSGSYVNDHDDHAADAYLDRGGIGSAGLTGRVFYDANDDGIYDSTDTPAIGVRVLAGGRRIATDSTGRYQAWNVVPYEVAEIAIDTLRSIDPSWVPRRSHVLLRPSPHVYNVVDFALLPTAELLGRVVADSGVATAGGVTLVLRDSTRGRTQNLVTFADGEFYLSRMSPGRYELSVLPASLNALKGEAEPSAVPFTIGAGTGPTLELPPIHIRLPYVPPEIVVVRRCPNPPAGVPLDSLGCPILFRGTRTVTLRGVNFALNRSELLPAAIGILAPIADALVSDTSLNIEVAGHTDARGSRALNTRLSLARAEAVRAFFAARGVAPGRMIARGYGPDQPVATNLTVEGRALNRRTELRKLDGPPAPDEFTVQVSRVTTRAAADRLSARLRAAGFDVRVLDQRGPLAVRVGRFATQAEAAAVLRRLRARRFPGEVTTAEPAPAR